ncbi:putative ATPase [Methanolinea mesophila]|uniref:AAA family ATPase n=1 Tax=Methanolinea mesophila TaxID=547055 RepID=UPI001AE4C32F|nr:AAA family ATPase [Methanolinea mesophila]MBP1929229.1 putative ATPase [Methanolinea mesophila]
MPIREIAVSNFKSFREMEISPDRFNIIIGSNASGKSNFIQIFKFIRDIAKYGLQNAISLQGGVEYFRNTLIGPVEDFSLRISYVLETLQEDIVAVRDGLPVYFRPVEITYQFGLKFADSGKSYSIAHEDLLVTGNYLVYDEQGTRDRGEGSISLSRRNHSLHIGVHPPDSLRLLEHEILPLLNQLKDLPPSWLMINMPPAIPGIPPLEWIFRGMKVFDFDPRLLKSAVPIMGKNDLEKDGRNLAIVIRNILEDPEKKASFSRLLNDMLPFVDEVEVEKFMDMSLFLKFRETYGKESYFPASMISDGTINLCALIIALYFEERPVTVIEEPERNIHPYLISRLVEMLRDASRTKQVIVTTHNPEMVRHARIEDILLITRDKDGFSRLERPANKKEVRTFLAHEIGIEDLFIQNLLGME